MWVDGVTPGYDGTWVAAMALSRGLAVGSGDAEKIAGFVGPILERFLEISGELTADDDMYEFRLLLSQEAERA